MTVATGPSSSRPTGRTLLAVLALVLANPPDPALGQPDTPAPTQAPPERQVTLFGVIASPTDRRVDPKLAKVEAQLRKLMPKHGFRLLDVKSKRLAKGRAVNCDLGGGFTAAATLTRPLDDNGKVELRCALVKDQTMQIETLVTTPPNQLFFCEKALDDGTTLLLGVGAR